MKVSELKASLSASVFYRGAEGRQIVGFTVATVAKKCYSVDNKTITYTDSSFSRTFNIIGSVSAAAYNISVLDAAYSQNVAYAIAEKFVFIIGSIIIFGIAEDATQNPTDSDIIQTVFTYEADAKAVPTVLVEAAKVLAERIVSELATGTADPQLDARLNDVLAREVAMSWGEANNYNPISKGWIAINCPRDSNYQATFWEKFGDNSKTKSLIETYAKDAYNAEYRARIAHFEKNLAEYLAANGYNAAQPAAVLEEEEQVEEVAENTQFVGLEFVRTDDAENMQFCTNRGTYPYLHGKYAYKWGSYTYCSSDERVYAQDVEICEGAESVQDAYEICAEHFANWEWETKYKNPTPTEPIDVRAHLEFSDPIVLAVPQPEAEAETAPAETVGNPEDEPTPIDPYLAECTPSEPTAPSIEDFPETAQPWGIEFLTNSQTASYNRGEYAYTWGAYSFTENLAGGEVLFLNPHTQEQTVIVKGVQSVVGAYGIAKAHWLDRQNPPKHIKGLNDLPAPESITDFDQYKIPAITEGVENYSFECGLGAFYMLSLPTTPLSLANTANPNLCAHLRYPNGLETTLPFTEKNTVLDFYRTIYHDWTHGAKSEYKPEFKHISDAACGVVEAPPSDTAEYSEQLLPPEHFGAENYTKLIALLEFLSTKILRMGEKSYQLSANITTTAGTQDLKIKDLKTGLYACQIKGKSISIIFEFYRAVYNLQQKSMGKL